MDPDRRVTELEIALTHQEVVLEDLSTIVREQADRIDILTAQVLRLTRRLASVEAALPEGESDPDRPPPHW